MTVQILRARDRLEMPWKNGGGVTREIAVFPPGADLDAFDWRVSMATVSTGGPFSIFPGVDRLLSVLEGELRLAFEDGATLNLTPQCAPAAFAGDALVQAETPINPATDLNVMTRRGRVRAGVTRVAFEKSQTLTASETTLILSLTPGLRLRQASGEFHLKRLDAALIEGDEGKPIDLGAGGPAMVFRIDLVRLKGEA
ncbi:MAG: HutD family protein [Pseudomonadota bacterium]|nr:HutD family protein [Pseudomonadota bacterium]